MREVAYEAVADGIAAGGKNDRYPCRGALHIDRDDAEVARITSGTRLTISVT
jgi:hypothetical protein